MCFFNLKCIVQELNKKTYPGTAQCNEGTTFFFVKFYRRLGGCFHLENQSHLIHICIFVFDLYTVFLEAIIWFHTLLLSFFQFLYFSQYNDIKGFLFYSNNQQQMLFVRNASHFTMCGVLYT